MNKKFDEPRERSCSLASWRQPAPLSRGELAKGLAQSVARRQALKRFGVSLATIALAALLALPADAQVTSRGRLVEISLPNPLAGCDDGFKPPGNITANDACEPQIAVNPLNPANIVAIWWGGLLQNAVAGVSFDGGSTWQRVPLPATVCAGGPWLVAGDVWVSFAPNGDLYAIMAIGQGVTENQIVVCKSTDGGLHWAAPVLVANSLYNVHGSITADPFDPRFVYAVCDGNRKSPIPADFTRSTDGGLTWEPSRIIFSVGPSSQGLVSGNQICVLPNGDLVALNQVRTNIQNHGGCVQQAYGIVAVRSTDRGQNWSGPISALAMTPYSDPCSGGATVFDPNTGQFSIEDFGNPMYAFDNRGDLYAVWEDGRWSELQYNQVAFAMSADGGFTWSAPIRVNQTPINLPPGNQQAFLPSVAVAADGTIGVAYYDFRFNGTGPGLLTDYWLVRCHPSAAAPATDPANWGKEVRMTDASFNLDAAAIAFGHFLGDYVGLAGDGNGFVAAFTAVDPNNHTAIFARAVGE